MRSNRKMASRTQPAGSRRQHKVEPTAFTRSVRRPAVLIALSIALLGSAPESEAQTPKLSVAMTSATETGNGTDTTMRFTISLIPASRETATVDYATADDSATAGNDYTATSGTLTYAAGEQWKYVDVTVHDDAVDERGETLNLRLSNATGGAEVNGYGIGSIWDETPSFVIYDASTAESDDGTASSMTFTVSLQYAPDRETTVRYTTRNGTAEAGSDHTSTSGTLSFGIDETQKTIVVPVLDDSVEDSGETFSVVLSNPSSGTRIRRNKGTARGTITEEAEPVQLGASFPKSSHSSTTHTGAEDRPQVVVAFTEPVATFAASSPSILITEATVSSVQAHTEDGLENAYLLTLIPKGNDEIRMILWGKPCDSGGICTPSGTQLTNIPRLLKIPLWTESKLSIDDGEASEENDSTIDFIVKLDPASTESVTVDYATSNGTATTGEDYTSTSGTLTFSAGDRRKTVSVPIINDAIDDDEETLTLTLSNASGAEIDDAAATGTIQDADAAASELSVADAEASEEDDATIDFVVTLEPASSETVTVEYETADGTATAGDDYTAKSGTLTFNPGETSKTIAGAFPISRSRAHTGTGPRRRRRQGPTGVTGRSLLCMPTMTEAHAPEGATNQPRLRTMQVLVVLDPKGISSKTPGRGVR